MHLESLANELLLNLFEYLSTAHLIRAFDSLNSRFNTLIWVVFRTSNRVDCRWMSQSQLDFICQQHLSSITHRIFSLCLSNDDETPQQIERFFSHGLKLDQFIHLRSLSFYHLQSEQMMQNIMIAWYHLHHLTHLKFSKCYFQYEEKDILGMINSIWSLSELTHCYLDITFRRTSSFIVPTVISSSLESWIIQGVNCPLNDLTRLFQHTIRLRHLCANIRINIYNSLLVSPSSSMISLKLKFFSSSNSVHEIINLFQNMCNLRKLTIETLDLYIDGYQWIQIIANYLPKLKIFQLKMEFYFHDRINTKQYVDQLLNSFQTYFWLEERQCLPRIEVSGCRSTCSDDYNTSWSYDHVHILNYRSSSTRDLTLYQSRFVNNQHLSLSFNVDNQFWFIVPRFDCSISLEIALHDYSDNIKSQLQTILDRASHLNLLKFLSWASLDALLVKLNSASVRQLDFRGCDRYYNDLECLSLINLPVGIQCEVLRINVENRMSILDFGTKMTNIRSLNVRCEDDKWNETLSTSKDEFIDWLQYRLPSTCIITRHTRYTFDILLWIC
ncbi:unnamed protein product [Rotaria sp. Silwood1]|nr:unnamed protein product [Rotaria sp. Silwood1]CAF4666750.1 unnamed protein product [Rotaria sp. Silwood1]